jgi:hypothetical protein
MSACGRASGLDGKAQIEILRVTLCGEKLGIKFLSALLT